SEKTYLRTGDGFAGSWRDFPTAVMEFPRRVMELFPGALDTVVLCVIGATVLGVCIWQRRREGRRVLTEHDRLLRWVLAALMIIAAIVLPLKLARLYRDFSNRNAGFFKLVAELPRGANTLVVVRNMMRGPGSEEKSGDSASSGPVYWHFSSWPMALNGGYGPY